MASKIVNGASKPARRFHKVEPVPGEPGRYYVDSFTEDQERAYIVDAVSVEETNGGKVIGTCPCKGWQVRKVCSHLDDARDYAADPARYDREREKRKSARLLAKPSARAVRRKR